MSLEINKLILFGMLLCLTGVDVMAEKMSFQRQLLLPAADLKSLEIIKGSGTMQVLGGEGNQITVDATIESNDYAEMAEFVEVFDTRVLFYLRNEAEKSQLMAKPRKSMYNTPNIRINLVVKLPRQLNLVVDDGYGPLSIENISGTLQVDNEAGSLKISGIYNDVFIDDGDGSMTIADINGQVNIEDKGGSIDATDINGNLTLDDGSGDVVVEGLNGQFVLLDDGSGTIWVNGESWDKK